MKCQHCEEEIILANTGDDEIQHWIPKDQDPDWFAYIVMCCMKDNLFLLHEPMPDVQSRIN